MELSDLFDGSTKYEFGRFKLHIKSNAHVDEQWFKNTDIEEIKIHPRETIPKSWPGSGSKDHSSL